MSSAKRINEVSLLQLGMLFVYIKNSRGPKTEPCGTPHLIGISLDLVIIFYYWFDQLSNEFTNQL